VAINSPVFAVIGDQVNEGTALNISEGGTRVRMQAPVGVGQFVWLTIDLAGQPFETGAEVVHGSPQDGWGLRFLGAPEGQWKLRDYVETFRGSGGQAGQT